MVTGIGLVILAAILQGIFLLPMAFTRNWKWEHSWLAFSLTGMLFWNWILTFISLPRPWVLYASVPGRELAILAGFGLAWGGGAVLFGLAMDMLGLALGYPLIMGLNAVVGTFVPLLRLEGTSLFAGRRILILAGTAVALSGISACSIAGAKREAYAHGTRKSTPSRFLSGLLIAVASGASSCLPNIGLTFASSTLRSAQHHGASTAFAGNAVWFIFFSFGGLVNLFYCCWLMFLHGNTHALVDKGCARNWYWALAMGAMWIGSFYLYGIGALRIGAVGVTIAWPIFVSLSIAVGVLCGLGKGEWRGIPGKTKALLWVGLTLILLAVLIIPFGTGS
jgi:L-rhamnose-H+ transport protein